MTMMLWILPKLQISFDIYHIGWMALSLFGYYTLCKVYCVLIISCIRTGPLLDVKSWVDVSKDPPPTQSSAAGLTDMCHFSPVYTCVNCVHIFGYVWLFSIVCIVNFCIQCLFTFLMFHTCSQYLLCVDFVIFFNSVKMRLLCRLNA